ncbi:hypothetical protein PflCFBP13517_25525 [Pseudomonas fluorescens]|nr:hypothetical protein PflCFBP13517_25525 [Pseudomonas fluorescens]
MGEPLAARIYSSEVQAPAPVLILCHGFCGIQDVVLPLYARAFVRAGFAVITFDYRGFGESKGERGRLRPALQLEDIHAVIGWAARQAMFDSARIGLWGTSLGGAHVAVVAGQTTLVKCFVSQMAFADGEDLILGAMSREEKSKFLSSLSKMQAKKKESGRELFVSPLKVLDDKSSHDFFDSHKADYPLLGTKIPFLTIQEMLDYRPLDHLSSIKQPALIIAAELDQVNPPEQARKMYESLMCEKSFALIKGVGHYDLYEGRGFKEVIEKQIKWLHEYL